ncbi:cytochrome c [Priestia filamentosa]|uniref:cytochrome c550 n=1 Tax=Priestia TaxID=2800373 RepID=UPI001FB1A2FF|nr:MULTISPECIES: cytochrome c [Priestia]MCY8233523.1 cytochrome c [Priestia endophytica]MED3725361.1 cytochrome c [Priestia filamentosa]UOE61390.1 cytochrome c [Priestia filamentosa]
MNRNPLVPFFFIMAFGILLMVILGFKGNGDQKELAQEKEGGAKQEETAASPEEIYKQTCISCHGEQYQGVSGPALKGVGEKLSQEEVKKIITQGKGGMPANLVPQEKADEMAKWVRKIE